MQIDNRGPSDPYKLNDDNLEDQLEYRGASGLMRERGAPRQSALYLTRLPLRPADPKLEPSKQYVRVAYRDLFPMFEAPFEFGGPWTAAADERRSPVVVISKEMNDKLFGGRNSIGKVINLGDEPYTVVGVLKEWRPIPHFYDLMSLRLRCAKNSMCLSPGPSTSITGVLAMSAAVPSPGRVGMHSFSPTARGFSKSYWRSTAIESCVRPRCWMPGRRRIGEITAWSCCWFANRHPTRIGRDALRLVHYFQTENLLIAGAGAIAGIVFAVGLNLWMVRSFEMTRIDNRWAIGSALVIMLLGQISVFWPALRASWIPPALATRGG